MGRWVRIYSRMSAKHRTVQGCLFALHCLLLLNSYNCSHDKRVIQCLISANYLRDIPTKRGFVSMECNSPDLSCSLLNGDVLKASKLLCDILFLICGYWVTGKPTSPDSNGCYLGPYKIIYSEALLSQLVRGSGIFRHPPWDPESGSVP